MSLDQLAEHGAGKNAVTLGSAVRIDDALLRKGRLLGMYEFKPLQPATANALAVQLGHSELRFDKPVTLAEVYNFTENNFTGPQMEQSGFRRQA